MAQLKVLISGAGIAGNALAYWLSKVGHEVTVIERFPELRTTGLQLDLRNPAIEVLKRMGLEQPFRSKSVPEQGIEVVNSSNKRWGYFPANKSGKGLQNFSTDWEIMRGDLCRLLHDANEGRTRYVFGSAVESFQEKETFIEVQFTNGKRDQFDLWVGADGSGSRARKMMLGSDSSDAFHPLKGTHVAYFTIPKPMKAGEEYVASIYTATGNRGIMTRRQNEHEIQVYMGMVATSEREGIVRRGNIKEQKAALADIYKDAGWKSKEILKGLEDSQNFYLEQLGVVKLQSWSQGRIVLLGDAAWCPSVNTGMGTTSAMVGAYVLAGEIQRHCGHSGKSNDTGDNGTKTKLLAALQAYDTKFRPFMDQVQKGVLESSENDWNLTSSALGITAMNCMVAVASLLKLNLARWFIKENVKDWTLPEYTELL